MHWLTWIAVGLIAGYAASVFLGMGKQMGLPASVGVGILGALLGGWTVKFLGYNGNAMEFNWSSLATAFVGALVLLFLFREFFTQHRD